MMPRLRFFGSRFTSRAGLLLLAAWLSAVAGAGAGSSAEFPSELVDFVPECEQPVFEAAGAGHWDARLRERGWILREGDTWRLWYTGYDGSREGIRRLGYATSRDGLHWTRPADAPLYDQGWVEDMMVVKHDGRYYMFAEGLHDRAQLLTSSDGLHWTREGTLDIRYRDGRPLSPGPFGTPTAWFENGTWHLFYERGDRGVWLATSRDLKVWTNLQDEPVLVPGPGDYDHDLIAVNQIVKQQDRYYAYYHGAKRANPTTWTTNVATSTDLVHWRKYEHNPLVPGNQSSGILVDSGHGWRLYTMHDQVRVYRSRARDTVHGPHEKE
jgi:beta-1,2-mannobiose phosphorylase / 1,2-beta-oligomannan phosphorylase